MEELLRRKLNPLRRRDVSLWLVALLFACTGLLHLIHPQPFVEIVPPFVPDAAVIVLLSGAAEIAGAVGILVPFTRPAARWSLAALLIAVFPANIYMAVKHIQPQGFAIPAALLWARLPLQPLLIWWVMAATKPRQ